MKKRTVIKLSGRVFSMENTKDLKDYAAFFVKKSKTTQPVIVAGGGKEPVAYMDAKVELQYRVGSGAGGGHHEQQPATTPRNNKEKN